MHFCPTGANDGYFFSAGSDAIDCSGAPSGDNTCVSGCAFVAEGADGTTTAAATCTGTNNAGTADDTGDDTACDADGVSFDGTEGDCPVANGCVYGEATTATPASCGDDVDAVGVGHPMPR